MYASEIRRAAQRIGVRYEHVVWDLGLDLYIGEGEEWWLAVFNNECLPKDLEAFVILLREWPTERRLLETVLHLRDEDLGREWAD
jgi:UDP-glucose 6-dehydrogenase